MRYTLAFLLAALPVLPCSAGGPLIPSFDGVRPVVRGGVVPVRYKTEKGPGYRDPDEEPGPLPNLTGKQLQDFGKRLERLDKAKNGGKGTMELRHAARLVQRLEQMDRHFVDPIAKADWERILGEMAAAAEREYDGQAGDWDKILDKSFAAGVRQLKDAHSSYMDPEQTAAMGRMAQGSYEGIGAELEKDGDGARIRMVFPDSPAERAGLQEEDLIVAVAEPGAAPVPAKDKPLDELVLRILGKDGTPVHLFIRRGGRDLAKPVVVARGKVARRVLYSKMVAPDIGYLYFSGWTQENLDHALFRHATRLLSSGARKIILDVRNNPGGRVDIAASVISEFLKDGQEIVRFKRQGQVIEKLVTDGDGIFSHLPVAVLVNGGSASASEILAGAMQDHSRAPIVIGSRSYGKGTRQTILPSFDPPATPMQPPAPDGRLLRITDARWHTPDDRSIDAQHDPATGEKVQGTGGIEPDIEVAVTPEEELKIYKDIQREMNGRPVANPTPDPVLRKAIEALRTAA